MYDCRTNRTVTLEKTNENLLTSETSNEDKTWPIARRNTILPPSWSSHWKLFNKLSFAKIGSQDAELVSSLDIPSSYNRNLVGNNTKDLNVNISRSTGRRIVKIPPL